MLNRLQLFAALGSLTLLGCVHRLASPLRTLDEAGASAAHGGASARTLALGGFHAWLSSSDVTLARSRFEAALQKDPTDPFALHGQLLIARHDGHPERALVLALTLLERAPRHPLASAAARAVGDMVGVSPDLDAEILKRAPVAFSRGLAGDAALLLRGAVGAIQSSRSNAAAKETFAAMGTSNEVTLAGPFSPFQILEFDKLTPPEQTQAVDGLTGPYGALPPRRLTFSDGRWNLSGEAPQGDMFIFALDVDSPQSGHYVVRTAAGAPFKLYLDGRLLYQRRSFEHTASTVSAQGVRLGSGSHRLLLKVSREEHAPNITLSVFKQDGTPSNLKLRPARGPAPKGEFSSERAELVFPRAADLREALTDEAGPGLAAFLAIRDGMGRDRDGCKRLLGELGTLPKAPAWNALRAELALGDHTIPAKVARGRATRDLELTLDGDKSDVPSLLERATLALEETRSQEALELVKQARAAYTPVGYPVLALESRIDLALGVDAQADKVAQESLRALPGLCEATGLRYDLAMRRDAVAQADTLVRELSACPTDQGRMAEHTKTRGQMASAAELYERLLAKDPTSVSLTTSLVGVDVGLRRFDAALRELSALRSAWPRNVTVLKKIADVQELAGHKAEALATREAALALDGSDLTLRRWVERTKTGKEPLADHAISGEEAIRYYEAHGAEESAASAYVLDAAAVQAYPDGSMVDRIHIVHKVLDQSGIAEVAEVTVPQGAQVLTLRTRKADKTALEPETIEGKETVSLPGVAVGDYVEYEYLYAHPSRGPAQPGFTASSFYFQIAKIPDSWCSYTVLAPKGMKMGVEAHHMTASAVQMKGDQQLFFHEERRVPPLIPEPDSPPSPNEYLPFVTVGAGAEGTDGLVSLYADGYGDRGALTTEVEDFARGAASGKHGLAAARAVYGAVMQRLSGRDSGLTQSASGSLAQERGSRLWLLKASLEALGIPTRIALIQTFNTDPAPYRYPNEQLLPYLALRSEVPGSTPVWLDAAVRFGPFGLLPEMALGERTAFLLPEPGRPLVRTVTPKAEPNPGRQTKLFLTLGEDGKLTGSAEESYVGYEAAQLGEGLESLPLTERNQALQSGISRYFPGAELTKLEVLIAHQVGAPMTLKYAFVAPRFGRVEGKQITLPTITFPAHLGRRYVQVSSRSTTLFVDSTEASTAHIQLTLPKGYVLGSPIGEVKRDTKFGRFSRKETQDGSVLTIDESFSVPMQRIAPKAYDDFTQFAGEIDLIQARDLILEKR